MSKIKIEKDNVVLSVEQEELAQYEARGYKKLGVTEKVAPKDLQEVKKLTKAKEELETKVTELEKEKEELTKVNKELETKVTELEKKTK